MLFAMSLRPGNVADLTQQPCAELVSLWLEPRRPDPTVQVRRYLRSGEVEQ
jgi:hypothetical protein